METIDDLYRKYSVKVNGGSGCLFQPDTNEYTYVLTAKHCICKGEYKVGEPTEVLDANEIKVYSGNEQNEELEVLEVFPHNDKQKDAAILKIGCINEKINLSFTSCQGGDSVRFFGYPNRLKDQKIKTDGVNSEVDMFCDKMIKIVPKKAQFSFDARAHENIKGFSGCGVFKESSARDDICLVGILSRLVDSAGAGDSIWTLPVDYFNEILSENALRPLIPKHLTSFDEYIKNCWKNIPFKRWQIVLEQEAQEISKKGINPLLLLGKYHNVLLIPENPDSINDCKLWSGWIEFLVYCKLISNEFLLVDKERIHELLEGKQFFYSGEVVDWTIIIEEILEKYKNKLKVKDKVVVNCNGNIYLKKITKQALKKILNKIDDAIVFQAENVIDRVSSIDEDIGFVHISEFRDRIGKRIELHLDAELKNDQIKSELKECIFEAFK